MVHHHRPGIVPTSMMIEKYRKYLQIEVRFASRPIGGSATLARQYGGQRSHGDGLVQIWYRKSRNQRFKWDRNQNYTSVDAWTHDS